MKPIIPEEKAYVVYRTGAAGEEQWKMGRFIKGKGDLYTLTDAKKLASTQIGADYKRAAI